MNFHYMPEIPWRYGYPFALMLMWLSGVVMIIYFKRKRWM
jgi:magnesium transporter